MSLTFTEQTMPWSGTGDFPAVYRVAYGGGYFIAADDQDPAHFARSADGTTWSDLGSGGVTNNIGDLAYGNGRWVLVGGAGEVWTSDDDGTTWTSRTSTFGTSPATGVHYAGGLWVMVGSLGKIATSPDGATWTSRTSGFGTTLINAVDHDGTNWVIAGNSGKYSYASDPTGAWTNSTMASGLAVASLANGGGTWVAITTSSHWATSTDNGVTWTDHTSLSEESVAYGGGQFVAVGQIGSIYSSPDGLTWSAESSHFSTVFPGNEINDVAYGAGVWVIGGENDNLVDNARIESSAAPYVLQYRSEVDGALLNSVGLAEAPESSRRTPDGQHVFIQQGTDSLVRYNRRLELEDTVTISGFFPVQDWNCDDQYNLFRLADDVLYRYHADGSLSWSVDLNAAKSYHFPDRAPTGGNGLQLYTGRSSGNGAMADGYVRVVGYIGGADWTTGSDACLLVIRRSDGTIENTRRWSGDSSDGAQGIAIAIHGNCLYVAGAAQGSTFEDLALSGTQGFIVRVPVGLSGSDGGVEGAGLDIGEDV